MGDNIYIEFYIHPKELEREWINKLVDGIKSIGAETGFEGIDEIWNEICLKEGIRFILKKGGDINFRYKNISFFLRFHSNGIGNKLNAVSIMGFSSQFKDRPDNCSFLIEIAKAAWNSIEPKPIYGIGDDEYYIEAIEEDDNTLNNILQENENVTEMAGWVTFYGPGLVERLGLGKLLNAPAYKVEKLKDGVLIINCPMPSILLDDSSQDTGLKVREYFGWKHFTIDIFDEDKPELAGHPMKSIESLRKELQKEITEFRRKRPDAKITVSFDRGYKRKEPFPEKYRNLKEWLKRDMKVWRVD